MQCLHQVLERTRSMIALAVALDTDEVSPSWNSCSAYCARSSTVEYSPGADFRQTLRARLTAAYWNTLTDACRLDLGLVSSKCKRRRLHLVF